jgi:mono/diheme cytochrome c family protein
MPIRRRLLATLAAALGATAAPGQDVDFARDVLPILSDRCFQCHGPDANARKGDLRLDDRLDVLRARDGYAVVTAGKPDESELIARLTAADDDVMPPRHTNLKVTADEVALLRRWIEQGATWSVHWAFAPSEATAVPQVRDRSWPRNGIDHFVLARLETNGARPNAAAEPAALLRRLHLDLTGLPPTPEQVDAFVADPSEARYLEVVDALLASPHYGERMAWPWLEAARYADTDGFQNDPTRTAWPWRDWLVRALNDNLPFDRFTTEVLAGDLLDAPTDEQRLATGLLRNNPHNGEGGRIPEETRVENAFDRTETVGTVWLGMTFECARCHDHKYDPISQRDYYRFYSFFDQSSETGRGRSGGVLAPSMRFVPDAGQRAEAAEVEAQIARLTAELQQPDEALDRAEAVWARAASARVRAQAASLQAAKLSPWRRSKPFRAGADAMFAETFAPERGDADAGWRPEPDFVDGKVLRLPAGAFTTYFTRQITAASARRLVLSLGSDDAIKLWCNGELVLAKDVRRGAKADQERVEVQLQAGDNRLLLKIVNTGGIGGAYFRVAEETVGDLAADVVRALQVPSADRDAQQALALQRHYRRIHQPGFREREAERQQLQQRYDALLRSSVTVSVMDQLPEDKRRDTRVLARGDYQTPGEAVQAGTPSFLPPLLDSKREPDRLALARWLVSGDNPLVARVAANRAWQTFFGRGLVTTSENFGRQGERPTHPELLEWLGQRFVAGGWDVKAMHRLIVTSATYRQSAATSAERFEADPDNRTLARFPRRRMPAWMLRDQALALSGQLVPQLGGPPVRPYQPAGIWAEATFGFIRYTQGSGDELRRRSLYTFWRRIVGPTMLFDTPARQQCVVRRAITNTPLHALTTLNETGFVEAARGFAARALEHGDRAEQRIGWLFRAATARPAEADELRVLTRRFAATRARFVDGSLDRDAFLGVGTAQPAADLDRDDLAAMTVVASLVLNLDEVLCLP